MAFARVNMGDQFRVTMAGHSFISRMESAAGEQMGIPHDFGLPDVAISYISRPGGRFSTFNRGEFIGSLVDTNPQLVILQMGG